MRSVLGDLHAGLRYLARQPFVTTVAVLSLAIGLAAAASLTSLLDAFGFRPLAVENPDALVVIQLPTPDDRRGPVTSDDLADLRTLNQAFAGVAGSIVKGVALTGRDRAAEVTGLTIVTADYFDLLGVGPSVGRTFLPTDDRAGASPVAMLSSHLWTRRFGQSSAAVGSSIELNGTPCTIIGILPASFAGLEVFGAADVWIPGATWPQLQSASAASRGTPAAPTDRVWGIIARRRPGVTLDQAQAAVQSVEPRLLARLPASVTTHAAVVDLQQSRLGNLVNVRTLAWTLVGLVMLIGCANVAGLLLGQGEARRRELAIRAALGAGRARLVRMLIAESALLALLAGVAAMPLGWWIIRAFPALVPPTPLPFGVEFRFDARVMIVTLTLAIATVAIFGTWPAFRAADRNVVKRFARTAATPSGLRWLSARNLLVVGQVAVSTGLLVAGGLLIRGLDRSRDVDPGFERRPMLLATIVPALGSASTAQNPMFVFDLVERLERMPGVAAAAFARRIPLSLAGGGMTLDVSIVGQAQTWTAPVKLHYNAVSPGYFETMGTHLVRGRAITTLDGRGARRVAVINQALAQQYWTDETAVGQVLHVDGQGDVDIIGVAETGKYNRLSEAPQPYLYLSAAQSKTSEVTLIVKTTGDDATAVAPALRATLRDADPGLPILQLLTLDEHLQLSTFDLQIGETVMAALGLAGLVLCVAGLYGVIAFVVTRRMREFGIRLALGASPGRIRALVIRQGCVLAASGLALAYPIARVAGSALGNSLYGVNPGDPPTYIAVAALVGLVTVAAAWAPASRAMRVNPVTILQAE